MYELLGRSLWTPHNLADSKIYNFPFAFHRSRGVAGILYFSLQIQNHTVQSVTEILNINSDIS